MPGFLSRRLDHLLHRSRSRSRDREPSQATTTNTDVTNPHHVVEFVKSPDGLTYIAPPYMVGAPVTQWSPAPPPPPKSAPSSAPSAPLNSIPLEPSLIFTNPVLTGWNAEPSIVRVGTEFFLTTASGCYFPGLPIYRSENLLNWELAGHGLGRKEQWADLKVGNGRGNEIVEEKGEGMSLSLEGIRTPTLRVRDGVFYLVACWWEVGKENLPRSFYIHSNNILDDASWSEPVFLDSHGLGQDLFFNDDGKAYLNTTGPINHSALNTIDQSTISTSEIDLATGKSLKVPMIVQSNHSNLNGASRIIKRDKYYYLFTTETTGPSSYQGCVSRSEQGPFLPWEPFPQNPIWCDGPDDEIQKISHIDVFEDAEEKWWAVFSCMRPRKEADEECTASVLGPETFLVKVDWEDDWPTFNGGKKISTVTSSHSDKLKTSLPYTWMSNFRKSELEIGWYSIYPPPESNFYAFLPESRFLRIHARGKGHNLSSSESSPAMLLRRQTSLRQAWKVLLTFRPSVRGSEAGIIVWVNRCTYCALGVRLADESEGRKEGEKGGTGRVVSLMAPDAEGRMRSVVVQKLPKYDCVVGLDVEAKDGGYHFSVSTQKDYDYVVASVPYGTLMKSVAAVRGDDPGAMFGLYALMEEEPCTDVADFGDVLVVNKDRS